MKPATILLTAIFSTACLNVAALAQPANDVPNTQPAAPAAPAASQPMPTDLDVEHELAGDQTHHKAHNEALDKAWRFDVYLENDSSWLKPNHVTDRWYTNGIMVSLTHQPDFAQDLLPSLPFAESFAKKDQGQVIAAMGYHGAQLIFTPQDIVTTAPQPNDRPFAGYLYGGIFLQRANDVTLDHFQVDIGMVGPSSLASDTQRFIHRNFSGDNPRGWDNQLQDEPTIQTYLRKKWRLGLGEISFSEDPDANPLSFQIIPEAGIAVGTVYRHVEAGFTLRAGFVIPDDFGPGYIANLASATGHVAPQGWNGYAFVGAAGKIVEHNMFLDGSDFHHNTVEVKHQPFTGQASAGISLNYVGKASVFNFTYSQIYVTRQFLGQHGTPSYGAVHVSWSFAF